MQPARGVVRTVMMGVGAVSPAVVGVLAAGVVRGAGPGGGRESRPTVTP
jgi:hypothetical protein